MADGISRPEKYSLSTTKETLQINGYLTTSTCEYAVNSEGLEPGDETPLPNVVPFSVFSIQDPVR